MLKKHWGIGLAAASLLVSFALAKTVKLEDRHSWYEQFISSPEVREELDYMDSQMLGESVEKKAFQGQVLSAGTQEPLENVEISLKNAAGKTVAAVKTNRKGIYYLRPVSDWGGPLYLTARLIGYSALTRTITPETLSYGTDFELLPSRSEKINQGETKTVADNYNRARLSVPAEILKRLDGKFIQYPVNLSISYIDPERDLKAMPGVDMLTLERGNVARVMTSFGAVNIEAVDASGADVRIDPELIRKTGKSTRLWIKLKEEQNQIKDLNLWDFDPQKNETTWKKTSKWMKMVNQTEEMQKQKLLSRNFLNQYANNIVKRFTEMGKTGTRGNGAYVYGCSNKNPISGFKIRYAKELSAEEIQGNLLDFILNDLSLMKKIPSRNLCKSRSGEDDLWSVNTSWRIFDMEASGQWYRAGSYGCQDFRNYITYPESLSPDFDYSALEALVPVICSLQELHEWQNALEIRNVDLIPFNLDKPFKGAPILVKLKETSGDGRFKVILERKGRDGNFYQERIVFHPSKEFVLKTLVPDDSVLEIKIYGEFAQLKPVLTRKVRIQKAVSAHKWNENKTHLLKEDGSPIQWMELEELSF